MSNQREIRADFDSTSIVVYQAYSHAIADAALAAGKFAPPFSLTRMTWIKPSFLWLMERSNWGRRPGQERILAVRMTRAGWDEALSLGVLTSFAPGAHRDFGSWEALFRDAAVHIQWDPERSIQGRSLDYECIQVGLSRQIIERYVHEWTLEIQDYTPRVVKLYELIRSGGLQRAKALLPVERVYPVSPSVVMRLNCRPEGA